MVTFQHLQRKPRISSTPAPTASSLWRPSRPFAPFPIPISEQAHPVMQAQREHTARFGHSLEYFSIFPPERKNATSLPDALKAGMETLSGMPLDDVKVHYNSSKPAQMQVLAYTQGAEIHVGPGQEKHLPHEAWHVVQQKQGRVQPTFQTKDVAISDDQVLEKEADVMGDRAQLVRDSQLMGDVPSQSRSAPVAKTPIQAKITVAGDPFEEGVDPQKKWNLNEDETLFYTFILKHSVPNEAFNTVAELLSFIRQYAPIFTPYARFFFGTPIAADTIPNLLAKGIEQIKEGHSLERHGPQMTTAKLEARLTTGYIDTAFAPVGSEGYATSFNDYPGYLASQYATVIYVQACYNRTVAILQPLINAIKANIVALDGLIGPAKGVWVAQIKKARNDLGKAIADNGLGDPNRCNPDLFPVRYDKQLFKDILKLPQDQSARVDDLLLFFEKYKYVRVNAAVIGKGKRATAVEKNFPVGVVRNPRFIAGKLDPIWATHQLEDMAPISNTSTTFEPPSSKFVFNANIATWKMPQHFPDNGAEGWRSS